MQQFFTYCKNAHTHVHTYAYEIRVRGKSGL